MDTGDDIRDGDVENGEPGASGGDALLLRDIGGLVDHNVEVLPLEQAGIFRFFSVRFRFKDLPRKERVFTNKGAEPICRNPYTQDSYLVRS